MMQRMVQLTDWLPAISLKKNKKNNNYAWLAKERDRILAVGDRQAVIKDRVAINGVKYCSVWVNELCGMPGCRADGTEKDHLDRRFYCPEHIDDEDHKVIGKL